MSHSWRIGAMKHISKHSLRSQILLNHLSSVSIHTIPRLFERAFMMHFSFQSAAVYTYIRAYFPLLFIFG